MEFSEKYLEMWKDWETVLNDQLYIGKLWVWGVIGLIIYLIYEELNYNYPDVYFENFIDKILYQLRHNHVGNVNFRRSLLVGLFTAFILCWLLFYPFEIPPGFIYFFLTLIIFGVTYFSTAWMNSHWWRMNDYKIENALLALRNRSTNK